MKQKSYEENIQYLRKQSQSLSILVIEDDNTNLELILKVLQPFFALCIGVNNIKSAKNEMLQHSFDIVISDISLPDSNGLDFIKQVKQTDSTVKFIVVSGYEITDYFIQAIEIGVDSFVVKPVVFEKLFLSLTKVCSEISKRKELEQKKLELDIANKQTLDLLSQQDKFIKDALHEINTPLAVIMTTLDLLKMNIGEHYLINRIEAASKTLQNSFNDLTYHALNGAAQIKTEAINLPDFINERIEYFKPIISANALELIENICNEKCFFQINPVKLQRLIDNNMSNAIKYSFRNPGKIYIDIELIKSKCKLSFKNFGPRIADKNAIFDRFYREDGTKGGYGIGLSLVKEICKEEGIGLKVESSLKNGNIFTYTFPIQIKGVKNA